MADYGAGHLTSHGFRHYLDKMLLFLLLFGGAAVNAVGVDEEVPGPIPGRTNLGNKPYSHIKETW